MVNLKEARQGSVRQTSCYCERSEAILLCMDCFAALAMTADIKAGKNGVQVLLRLLSLGLVRVLGLSDG